METHRNKVRASEVPNDSGGCADAHVANDGEKPPVRKQTRVKDRAGSGSQVREVQRMGEAPKKSNYDVEAHWDILQPRQKGYH